MEYKIVNLEQVELVGKSFEFPTSEIQSANYQMYYGETCNGMNPTKSFGIYQVGEEVTKFTVAIKTETETSYENVIVQGGEYFEFEINFMENIKDNQYTKCFDQLIADGVAFDMGYSVEIMDQSFNPMEGQYKFKYYIRKAN